MNNISVARTQEIINNFSGKKIAVIGDVMLDRFFWGNVSRISPEAPVPVIDLENESSHLGGAANVASNISTLGAKPILYGIVGKDNSGKIFIDESEKVGIETSGIVVVDDRPTTVKTRIIGNNQHIVRLDREVKTKIDTKTEQKLIEMIKSNNDLEAIVFEDYNKGVITNIFLREIINHANKKDIPVFVDPKLDLFFDYKNVTVFKPNRKEAQQALNKNFKTLEDIAEAGHYILKELNTKYVLLTLGADGMMLFEDNGTVSKVPTIARLVADVSGAGDTAIATLAASMVGGAEIKEAATLANFASGKVCEMPGVVSITIDTLLEAVNHNYKINN